MHSPDLELSQDKFEEHTTSMIDLLQDPLFLCTMADVQDNIQKIRKVLIQKVKSMQKQELKHSEPKSENN